VTDRARTERPAGLGRGLAPLYAAGFLTAFGAHSVAATLGILATDQGASLLSVGVLLAAYDAAEVVLKPVFGTLADRVGPRPVVLGGLAAFAVASAAFVLLNDPALLGPARFAQGAAAAAFSPAASAMVGRLTDRRHRGRAFGGYGAFKSLGYTAGPLAGGALIVLGGLRLLFMVLAVLAVMVAAWALLAVPTVRPLPRSRATLAELKRRLTQPGFLRPTLALAGSTAALAVGVGFLPLAGTHAGLSPVVTGALVSLLGVCAIIVQPWAGRARDRGRLRDTTGMAVGLASAAAGAALAAFSGFPLLLVPATVGLGVGTALISPVGFAHLADHTPVEHLGQTMGSAEIGRELGDAGGPLLVGGIAAVGGLTAGFVGLAALLLAGATMINRTAPAPPNR
jgi:MFS family permease